MMELGVLDYTKAVWGGRKQGLLEDVGSLFAWGKLLEHQRQSTELYYMAHLVVQEVEH